MYINGPFTKENLEGCLKELAKEYKKRGYRTPAETLEKKRPIIEQ